MFTWSNRAYAQGSHRSEQHLANDCIDRGAIVEDLHFEQIVFVEILGRGQHDGDREGLGDPQTIVDQRRAAGRVVTELKHEVGIDSQVAGTTISRYWFLENRLLSQVGVR